MLGTAIRGLADNLSAPPFKIPAGNQPKSRYSDKPYIKLDPKEVPVSLQQLIPLAKKWSIADEDEVIAFAKKAGPAAVTEFIEAFRSRLNSLKVLEQVDKGAWGDLWQNNPGKTVDCW